MYKYFTDKELSCRHCGLNKMNKAFMEKIDKARSLSYVPFIVTSAYRCKEHNKNVGGVEDSAHTKGLAIDILYKNTHELYVIVESLMSVSDFRIIIYPNQKFIHVDVDFSKGFKILSIDFLKKRKQK